MSIITITTGSYGKGQEVAEKVAATLGYRCISRETLLNASDGFKLPEIKEFLSFRKGPSDIELTSSEKEKYMACVQLLLLSEDSLDPQMVESLRDIEAAARRMREILQAE